jgi:hypothetical protein
MQVIVAGFGDDGSGVRELREALGFGTCTGHEAQCPKWHDDFAAFILNFIICNVGTWGALSRAAGRPLRAILSCQGLWQGPAAHTLSVTCLCFLFLPHPGHFSLSF